MGCGGCYAGCPFNAISMKLTFKGLYEPFIDKNKCTNCGVCDKLCPSLSIDQVLSRDPLGKYISCYVGYAEDVWTRYMASSGGIATTVLLSLFEKGVIEAAVVAIYNPVNPLIPEMRLVRDKNDIIKAMGSKYCSLKPVFRVLDLLEVKGKVAVVGLPCHIWMFRKLGEIYPKIRDKIYLYIGLLCGKTRNVYATIYFLRKIARVEENNVKSISYRGYGWPGRVVVRTKNGKTIYHTYNAWFIFSLYPPFMQTRCVFCRDPANQLSDISLGDAWRLAEDKLGSSLIITRSRLGEEVIQQLYREGKISLRRVSAIEVVKSQGLNEKVQSAVIRGYIWRRVFKQPIPVLDTKNSVSLKYYIFNLVYCTWLYLALKNHLIRRIMYEISPLITEIAKLLVFRRNRH